MDKELDKKCKNIVANLRSGILTGDECVMLLRDMLDDVWQEYINELEV